MFDSEKTMKDIDAIENERQKMLRRHMVANLELSSLDIPDDSMVIEKLKSLLKSIAEMTQNGITTTSIEEKDKILNKIKKAIESEFMTFKST